MLPAQQLLAEVPALQPEATLLILGLPLNESQIFNIEKSEMMKLLREEPGYKVPTARLAPTSPEPAPPPPPRPAGGLPLISASSSVRRALIWPDLRGLQETIKTKKPEDKEKQAQTQLPLFGALGHGRLDFTVGFFNTRFHAGHHANSTCNFAQNIELWDRLFGTYIPLNVYQAKYSKHWKAIGKEVPAKEGKVA